MVEVQGKAFIGTPKSHRAREVPIPGFLADELARHLAGRPPDDLPSQARVAGCRGTAASDWATSTGPPRRWASKGSPRTSYATPRRPSGA